MSDYSEKRISKGSLILCNTDGDIGLVTCVGPNKNTIPIFPNTQLSDAVEVYWLQDNIFCYYLNKSFFNGVGDFSILKFQDKRQKSI